MAKSKLFLGGALALVALLAAVSSATASTITRLAPGTAITSASSGKLTFGEGSIVIECELTLRGNLATGPIAATNGTGFGNITEVSIRKPSCSNGEVEGVLNLPWAIKYKEALPNQAELPNHATGLKITLNDVAFRLSTFFGIVNCLYAGGAGAILNLDRSRTEGVYTTTVPFSALPLRADETVRLDFRAGSGACPTTGVFRGTLGLSAVQTVTII